MNKEDVKKGYIAAMVTMGVDAQDADKYWESYERSQCWSVINHSDLSHVSGIHMSGNECREVIQMLKTVDEEKYPISMILYWKIWKIAT